MNTSLFIQGIIVLGCLFSGLFTTYYVVSEKWYQNYADFEQCASLPASLILCQVINLTLVIYLIGLNIYRCICKAVTNTKITTAFTCCSLVYMLLIIGAYIFAAYVFFKKECYDIFLDIYPHLWLCLEVLLITIVIILSITFIGGFVSCIMNKRKKAKEAHRVSAKPMEENIV